MKQTIGIIGLGDLGSQLASRITNAGFPVIAFDIDNTNGFICKGLRRASSQKEVLEASSIIHWAVPSRMISELEEVVPVKRIILHDSVMHNSVKAIALRADRHVFSIVHCLMNDTDRVFIDKENLDTPHMTQHFIALGLSPKLTTVSEHDRLMARSQGILASLITLGIKGELDIASHNGDLTPSASELLAVLTNRAANWTPQTVESILSNPELKQLTDEIGHATRH
jgi:prephenate dehydrogenase